MHPNIMPSRFINSLKKVTSRLIRKEFSAHFDQYYWKPVLWTRAYCLITASGAPIDILKQYIHKMINVIHLHPSASALWMDNSDYVKEK